jgi:hypothetical protein
VCASRVGFYVGAEACLSGRQAPTPTKKMREGARPGQRQNPLTGQPRRGNVKTRTLHKTKSAAPAKAKRSAWKIWPPATPVHQFLNNSHPVGDSLETRLKMRARQKGISGTRGEWLASRYRSRRVSVVL